MGTKLNIYFKESRGFVLITVLVLLSLLTILSIGLYFVTLSTEQDSAVAVKEEQSRYYAETGLSYVRWALANDADLDAVDVTVRAPAATPALFPATAADDPTVGDKEELGNLKSNPGPTTLGGTDGALMYFDNSPLGAGRAVQAPIPAGGVAIYRISSNLPRYIVINIGAAGQITTSISPMPHSANPVPGRDIPLRNGAVVWLTAGDAVADYAIDPTGGACGAGVITSQTACHFPYTLAGVVQPAVITPYSIVIYSVGYVDGRALALIRSVASAL